MKKKKSWKTTVFGIVAAAGVAMQASENPTVKLIGIFIGALGVGGIGAMSKDHDKTWKTGVQ